MTTSLPAAPAAPAGAGATAAVAPYRPRTGLLLVNLGTPDDTRTSAVRRYLREFLLDWRVIDVPWAVRQLIVRLLILPRRPRASAEAYRAIWTDRGSPLLFHGVDLSARVQGLVGEDVPVELAMRYGHPRIGVRLERLRVRGADRIVVFPLYPQWSASATGSALEAVYREAGRRWNTPFITVVPPYFDHPAFIAAWRERAQPVLAEKKPERVLFSFHGLPERQIRKSDERGIGRHCLATPDCCAKIGDANRSCYRAQCMATARAIGDALGIPEAERVVAFQSRLGKDPWIRPYTDEVIVELAKQGIQRLAVISPAFVADCLETLEEIGIRGAESFRAAGGKELTLVPSLNATDAWARAVVEIAHETAPYVPLPPAAAGGAAPGGAGAGPGAGS